MACEDDRQKSFEFLFVFFFFFEFSFLLEFEGKDLAHFLNDWLIPFFAISIGIGFKCLAGGVEPRLKTFWNGSKWLVDSFQTFSSFFCVFPNSWKIQQRSIIPFGYCLHQSEGISIRFQSWPKQYGSR